MSYVPAREEKKKAHPGHRLLGVVMCAALLGAPLLIPAASRVASLDRAELVSKERALPKPVAKPVAKVAATVPPTVVPPTVVPPTVVPPFTTAPRVTAAPKAPTKTSAKPTPTTAAPKPKARPTTTAAPKPAPAPAPAPAPSGNAQSGQASWYDTFEGTCAHKSLPKGTMVNVTNTANGKSVVCRVADRGPYVNGRVIDLDRRLFAQLASPSSGVIHVNISW